MKDEDLQLAKDKLRAAIMEYYATVSPDVFVDDWVVLAHLESVELTQEGMSSVSTLVPTGQAFHRTAGLLGVAYAEAVRL